MIALLSQVSSSHAPLSPPNHHLPARISLAPKSSSSTLLYQILSSHTLLPTRCSSPKSIRLASSHHSPERETGQPRRPPNPGAMTLPLLLLSQIPHASCLASIHLSGRLGRLAGRRVLEPPHQPTGEQRRAAHRSRMCEIGRPRTARVSRSRASNASRAVLIAPPPRRAEQEAHSP